MSCPKILLSNPTPEVKQRLYNGRKLAVWEGKVRVGDVSGWIDNPRIDLAKKKYQENSGQSDLSQEQVFELMKNEDDIKLKELRDDIIKNGLRVPITLSFDGRLLDGNRRFFALKYALEGMTKDDPNRQDLEIVSAIVLTSDASDADVENVLVEENFTPSLKIEWPDYVKAMKVIDANEDGLSNEEIAKKFNWSKTKVRETIRINQLIRDFESFAVQEPNPEDELGGGLGMSEREAEAKAAKNYQFFNEAQKSFFDDLSRDFDFKIQFFRWINDGKFSSFPEVRIAYKAWKDPEAKSAIMATEPTAAKAAKAILDYNSRVIRNSDEAIGRIEAFTKFLANLRVEEVKDIPVKTREKLQEALEVVMKMAVAASRAQ